MSTPHTGSLTQVLYHSSSNRGIGQARPSFVEPLASIQFIDTILSSTGSIPGPVVVSGPFRYAKSLVVLDLQFPFSKTVVSVAGSRLSACMCLSVGS